MDKDKKELGPEGDKSLPLTRWGLLKDGLHYHFFDFVLLSLLSLMFYLPSFLYLLYLPYSGLLDSSSVLSSLFSYLILVPLFTLAGLGRAGTSYCVKKMAFGEGGSLSSDFFLGIKKNCKMHLLVYFLISLLYLLLQLDLSSLPFLGFPSYVIAILAGVSYGLFFIFLIALIFVLPQSTIYTGSFFALFKNSWSFLFGAFLSNLPVFLAYLLPLLCYEFIPFYAAKLIVMGVYGIFYLGFSAFFLCLYSNYLFDKSINPRQFPELVGKGLGKIEK